MSALPQTDYAEASAPGTAPTPALAAVPAPPASPALRRAAWGLGVTVLLLLAGAGARLVANAKQAQALAEVTAGNAQRSVLFTLPRPGEGRRTLALPGTLLGRNEAAVYARTSGYLQRWTKDIGERVRKGELLAEIDAPESLQELAQARAAREQIRARLGLAQTSLTRWEGLRQRDAVSQQELDERRAAHQQAQADLAAADANIKRLEQLQSFLRITAPFDGVVVRRNVQVGELVGAGNNGTRELFHLAQTDTLRVDIAIPQSYAGDVRPGQEVSVKLVERPNAVFKGKVARVAGAVSADTRTMAAEVELPNTEGKLLPGAYVEVSVALSSTGRNLVVPASAVQFRQDGPRVAVVTADGRIALRSVKLGRDLGRVVEVVSGLGPKDRIVLTPHDSIENGERVLAKAAAPDKADASGRAASGGVPGAGLAAASAVGAVGASGAASAARAAAAMTGRES